MDEEPDDLFGLMPRRRRRTAALSARWLHPRNWGDRLASCLVVSVAVHFVLVGLLAIAESRTPKPRNPAATVISVRAARRALEALRLDPQETRTLVEALAGLDEETYKDIFENSPLLDPRLGEREQIEIFRTLMRESLGRLEKNRGGGLTALDFPSWGPLPGADLRGPVKTEAGDILFPLGAAADGRPILYKLPAGSARRLESLRASGEKERGSRATRNGKVEIRTEAGFTWANDEYFRRDCPYERMIALGGAVFYAVSGFPRIEVPEKAGVAGPRPGRTEAGAKPGPADAFKVMYMPAETVRERPLTGEEVPDLPPLAEENVPKILDALMALGEEDQVRVFMERFLNGRDPDDPLLARLTQRFLYENLGGAFNLGGRLSTAFDFLEELFCNKTSENEIIDYGLRNPRSRAGAEILLCLAALYDFERRGLVYLDDSLDEIEEVLAGRATRADVFDKPAKAFVLSEVHRDLVATLRRRGAGDINAVLREYRREQERIYRFLMEAGGEVRDRARYALGVMYWDGAEEGRAIEEWQAIGFGFETPVLFELRWLKSRAYSEDDLWNRIDRIFRQESAKNSGAALERMTKFHVWKKRSVRLEAQPAD